MENKILHFIFNEDQFEKDTFSKRILRKALPCWLVQDFPGFMICLESLPREQVVTIWVHLHAVVEDSKATFKGEDIAKELKRKFGESFLFEYITRADLKGSHRDKIDIIHINDLDDKVKDIKYHHPVADILNNHNKDKELVFVSHSGEDKTICDKLVNVLVNGYAIPRDKIVYTSGTGTGIPTSGNIPSELQKYFANVGMFISVLTENYLKSSIALAELNGIKLIPNFENKNIVILKSDDVRYKETGMFNEHDIILSLSNQSHFYKIVDDCKEFLYKYPIKIEKLHEELETYFS